MMDAGPGGALEPDAEKNQDRRQKFKQGAQIELDAAALCKEPKVMRNDLCACVQAPRRLSASMALVLESIGSFESMLSASTNGP